MFDLYFKYVYYANRVLSLSDIDHSVSMFTGCESLLRDDPKSPFKNRNYQHKLKKKDKLEDAELEKAKIRKR